MSQSDIRTYLSRIGRKGGQASRRILTPEQAREMAAASAKTRQKKAKKSTK